MKAFSPQGFEIVGTCETVLATAFTCGWDRDARGKITYDHTGESEIHWDSMETECDGGEPTFYDEEGNTCKLSEVVIEDDEDDEDGEGGV